MAAELWRGLQLMQRLVPLVFVVTLHGGLPQGDDWEHHHEFEEPNVRSMAPMDFRWHFASGNGSHGELATDFVTWTRCSVVNAQWTSS